MTSYIELEKRVEILESEIKCKKLEDKVKLLENEIKHLKAVVQYQLRTKKIK